MSKSCIEPSRVSRRHPLVLALAALCAASAVGAAPTSALPAVSAALRSTPASITHGGGSRAQGLASRVEPAAPASTFIVSSCADAGTGTLREAIGAASSGDLIDLTHLTCSTISLTTGALVLGQDDLVVNGPGKDKLTIDAANNIQEAAFYALGSGTLTLYDMTIANGAKYRSDVTARGGCVHAENAVTMIGVAVENCSVTSAGTYGALGGGIWTGGETFMLYSSVTGNSTIALGGGYASGGGVYADNGMVVGFSVVRDNAAIQALSTPSFGGGLFSRGFGYVLGTEVSGNSSARMAGIAFADNNGITSYLLNSTVSGNSATVIGGVYSRAPLIVYNSTIALNDATNYNNNGGPNLGAGLQFHTSLNLVSTIIAENTTSIPFDEISGDAPMTGSHNLISSSSTSLVYPGDTIIGFPFMGPLQDNGGITRTHALEAESPAIDNGTGAFYPSDARGAGFPRLVGIANDIGSYEFDPDMIFINGFN